MDGGMMFWGKAFKWLESLRFFKGLQVLRRVPSLFTSAATSK